MKAKKPDTKALRVKIPIYGGYLYVVYTDDFLQTGRSLDIEYDLDVNKCLGITSKCFLKGNTHYVMMLKHSELGDYNTISHESLHVVNMIFKRHGVSASIKEDEGQAYLLGWVVEQIQKYTEKINLK